VPTRFSYLGPPWPGAEINDEALRASIDGPFGRKPR
jgi:hypothetical protein